MSSKKVLLLFLSNKKGMLTHLLRWWIAVADFIIYAGSVDNPYIDAKYYGRVLRIELFLVDLCLITIKMKLSGKSFLKPTF
jgi:hypothetical protein